MRSKLFCILTTILIVTLLLGVGVIAFAQQTDVVEQDGLKVSLCTDKESYSAKDTIHLSVRVLNTADKTAQIKLQADAPSSMQVDDEKSQLKASVNPGEDDILKVQIGEISLLEVLLPWIIGGIAVIIGVVVLILLGKKKRGVVSAVFCLLLATACFMSAVPVQAANGNGKMSLSCNVLIDGAPVTLKVKLSYEMVDAVYTRESLENALVSTAWAYYMKEDKMQYCSQEITDGLSKYTGGNYRLTEDAAPEYGTSDTTIYSVCSDFVYKVYYEALGHRLLGAENYLGATTSDFWLKSEDVALMRWIQAIYEMDDMDAKYGVSRDKELNTEQARKFMENWKENLRPGDVIVFTGHAFLYVGNGYVMDCWGDKYTESTGLDVVEGNGSVHYLHTIEGLFLNGQDPITQSYVIMYNCIKEWCVVFRPLDAFVQEADGKDMGKDIMSMSELTEKEEALSSTRSRQAMPAMEIDRTVDASPYGTVATGEALTYSVAVSNKSNDPDYLTYQHYGQPDYAGQDYTGLVVTETVPEGTQLVEGSISNGGVYADGKITWTVDIPAGEAVALTYAVKVTAPVGSTIVSGGGFVGDIPSNTITNTVGGKKLSEQALEGLQVLAQTPKAQWRETYNISKLGTDLEFAERVYQAAMGIDLQLPTTAQILENMYTFQTVENESCSDRFPGTAKAMLYTLKDTIPEEYQYIRDMMVAGYYGGQKLYTPQRGQTINEFSFDYLEPGDILVYTVNDLTGPILRTEVSVYVGDGTLLVMDSRQRTEVLHTSTLNNADHAYAKIWNALARDMFFVLRPSQAYEDINTLTYDKANEPTYGKEPAEYVDPLGGYELEEKYLKALAALDAELNEDGTNQYLNKNMNFAEEVYQRIGLDITSATQGVSIATILKTAVFFDSDGLEIAPYSYNFLATPAENYHQLASMLVRDLRGGPYMQGCEDKLISISDLKPGDILNLINREDSRYWVCIYQGDGKLLTSEYTKGSRQTYKVYDFSEDTDGSAFKAFITESAIGYYPWECFYVMRPSQGFYNINDPTYDPNYKTPDITTGSYMILAKLGNEYYALQGETDKYKIGATKVEYKDGVVVGQADTWSVNVLKEFGTGLGVSISCNGQYVYEKERDVSNVSLRSSPSDKTTWRLLYDPEMKCYRMQTQSGDNRYLMYSSSNDGFKAYSDEDATQRGELLFIPVNSFDMKSGEYAVIAKSGDKYYAMQGTMKDKATVEALEVTPTEKGFKGKFVETWTLTAVSANGNVTLKNADGKYLNRTAGSANLNLGDTAKQWAVYKNTETGYYTLRNTNSDTRFLSYNGTGFKAYASANETRFTELLLVPASKITGLLSADMDTNLKLDASYYAMVAVVGNKYYAMNDSGDGYSMDATPVVVKNGKIVSGNASAWQITVKDNKGTVTLSTVAGKNLNRKDGSSNIKLTSKDVEWTVVRRKSTGYYTITNTNKDKRYLSYNGEGFKAYEKASEEHFINFMMIPIDPFAHLSNGKYVVMAKVDNQYFAMQGKTLADGVTMGAVPMYQSNGMFVGSGYETWDLNFVNKKGAIVLSNAKGEFLGRQSESSNMELTTTLTNWTLYQDAKTGMYTLRNQNKDTRYLSYNGTGFKAYTKATEDRVIQLMLVPAAQVQQAKVNLESGYYAVVAVAGDKYYAMGNRVTSGVAEATEVTLQNGMIQQSDVKGWQVEVLDDYGTITLANNDGKFLVRAKSSSNLALANESAQWTVTRDADGCYTIANESEDSRYLSYNGEGFKAYAAASDTRFIQFKLIPVQKPEPKPQQKVESGYYVLVAVANDKYYAMGNQVTSGVAEATEVTLADGKIVGDIQGWQVEVLDENGTITLANADGKFLVRAKSSSNLDLGNNAAQWTLAKDAAGYYTITNVNGDSRYLSYNGTGFKAYAAASDSRFIQFMLVPMTQPEPEPEPEPEPKPEEKLETGAYVLVAVAGDKYYAMDNLAADAYSMKAVQVTVENGAINSGNPGFWHVNVMDESGNVQLRTPAGQYLTRSKKSSNISLGDTAATWTAVKNENGFYTFTNVNSDTRYLSYNGTAFKAYAAASDTRFLEFMLIPARAVAVTDPETVTTGQYMVVAKYQDGCYAMTRDSDGYLLKAKQVTLEDGGFAIDPALAWELTVSGEGAEKTVSLGFAGNYLQQSSKSSSNVKLTQTPFDWKLSYDAETASFRLQSSISTRFLMFTTGNSGSFKAYASADETKAAELLLIKLF